MHQSNHEQDQTRVGKRKYKVDENYFSEINTQRKAYWLGFIAADGSVGERALKVQIKEPEHLRKLKADLGSEHPITQNGRSDKENPCYDLSVGSKQIVADLTSLGVGKQKTMTLEPWDGPSRLLPHYWRGMVDGDGWVTDEGNERQPNRWTVALCGNLGMVEGFRRFVKAETGIDVSPVQYPEYKYERPFYHVAYTGTNYPKAVASLLYKDAPVALGRKRNTARAVINWTRSETHGNAKATADEIRKMVTEFMNDPSLKTEEVTRQYDVTSGVLTGVLSGKTWTHLDLGYSVEEMKASLYGREYKSRSGVGNTNSKLTARQVVELRSRYEVDDGPSQTRLAEEYGISQHAVSKIVRYESYTDVE